MIIQDLQITDLGDIEKKYFPKQELYRLNNFNTGDDVTLKGDRAMRVLMYLTHNGCEMAPECLSFHDISNNKRWKDAVVCPVCELNKDDLDFDE